MRPVAQSSRQPAAFQPRAPPAAQRSPRECARLVNQQTAWQVLGRRGVKDGKGYMETVPGDSHPAMQLR